MVYNRLNLLRIFTVMFLGIFFIFLFFLNPNNVQYSLVKAILPSDATENSYILQLSEKNASTLHVIFEANNDNLIIETEEKFLSEINSDFFEIITPDVSTLLDYYTSAPTNFISSETRKKLLNSDYNSVFNEGMERLYNPASIQLVDFDKDVYSLLYDFLISNQLTAKTKYINGKYYSYKDLRLKPTIKTDKIKDLEILKNKYENHNIRIYLSGTPVHTYSTSSSSTIKINFICTIITLLIAVLTYLYFKNIKLLIPIALSLAFGFIGGVSIMKFVFNDFHIVTLLFASALIGIGIDYSLHYIFAQEKDKTFYKNFFISLFSTILAFSLLFFIKIEILSQIAVFTISGLTCVCLFIIIIYPCLDFPDAKINLKLKFNKYTKLLILSSTTVILLLGGFKIHFNDNLTALYTPTDELKQAELVYSKIINPDNIKTNFLTVKGKNFEDLLQKEEEISKVLEEKNIKYICISNYILSENRQKENYELIKKLYKNNLSEFKDILTSKQIKELQNQDFTPKTISPEEFPYSDNFLLSPTTSVMIYFSPMNVIKDNEYISHIDIQTTVSKYLKEYRISLLKILPFVYILILFLITVFYGIKKSLKMLFPIVISSALTISLISILKSELNLFNLIGILLALGFTVDYTIFSSKNDKNTQNAILLACITTSASFLLLSFTTFTLLNSLCLTLFLGIISAYIFIKLSE